MIKKEMVSVDAYYCDACGERIYAHPSRLQFSFSRYSSDGGVLDDFTYTSTGHYCGKCLHKLYDAITERMPVPNNGLFPKYDESLHTRAMEIAYIENQPERIV